MADTVTKAMKLACIHVHVHVHTMINSTTWCYRRCRKNERKKERHLRQWKNENDSCLRWDSNPWHSVLQTDALPHVHVVATYTRKFKTKYYILLYNQLWENGAHNRQYFYRPQGHSYDCFRQSLMYIMWNNKKVAPGDLVN